MRNELINLGVTGAKARVVAHTKMFVPDRVALGNGPNVRPLPSETGAGRFLAGPRHLAEPSYAGAFRELNALQGTTQGGSGRHVVGPRHLAEPSFAGANREFAALMGAAEIAPGRHVAAQRSGILGIDPRAGSADSARGAADAANKRVAASATASADQIRARNAVEQPDGQPITFGRPKVDADLIAIGNGSNMNPTPQQIARLRRAFEQG